VPLYEYRCLDCNQEYEKREGFDASALQECPNCGGTARRVLHAPPIVFKGSGFYVTDSRKSAPEAETAASVDTKPSTEPKTEAKPAKDSTKPVDSAAAGGK
jgi:putative FmdB family regulatory protein